MEIDGSMYALRNTSPKWLPTDSFENYQKNVLEHPTVMKQWEGVDITYDMNEYGFRSPPFSESNNNIVVLGCSHTVGVGLPLEKTWAYLVSEALGMNLCNLAVIGGSNDTCYRLGSYWIPILKPKIVIHKVVSEYRFEMKVTPLESDFQYWHSFLPAHDNTKTEHINFGDFYSQWVSSEDNLNINRQKNIDAIEMVSSRVGSKFYDIPEGAPSKFGQQGMENLARDLMHPGAEQNKYFSEKILEEIEHGKK